jgi:hypothetical protein
MRPDETRAFADPHDVLDVCNDDQVRAWANHYEVDPDEIREVCEQVGGNRTAVELKLAAPRG